MARIAIHGFGRIGRSLMRVALKDNLFVPASISDIKDIPTLAALFEVDTNYGRWPEDVKATESGFVIGGREIPYFDSMKALPDWKALGVDLVIDCTGRATTRPGAQAHLDAGAKRVLVSAPSKKLEDCDAVLLPGINLDSFDPGQHKIISMASCTTNALAPVVKVVIENFGIKNGLFSTVHAYTNTQALTDQPMKDRRDSWAAAENIIPSSSGAARALAFIWKGLNIAGKAYRVPTRTGSIAELNLLTERPATVDAVKSAGADFDDLVLHLFDDAHELGLLARCDAMPVERGGKEVHGNRPVRLVDAHAPVGRLHVAPLVAAGAARELAQQIDHAVSQVGLDRPAKEPRELSVGQHRRHEVVGDAFHRALAPEPHVKAVVRQAVPDADDVDVEFHAQRRHVHPAHAHALGAVEPLEPRVGRRIRRGHDHGWQHRPVVAQRPGVAVGTQVEDPAVRAEHPRAVLRLEARLHVDDRDAVAADAHPVRGAGQHDGIETGAGERALRDVPVDSEPVRGDAHDLFAEERGQRAEERRSPRIPRLRARVGRRAVASLTCPGHARRVRRRGLWNEAEHRQLSGRDARRNTRRVAETGDESADLREVAEHLWREAPRLQNPAFLGARVDDDGP